MLTFKRCVLYILIIFCFSKTCIGQDISFDLKYGTEAAIQIERMIGIYDDSTLTDYIKNIGNKLIKQLDPQPFDYKFFILDSEDPNAFALPGGYIYVTRGLLPIVENEDELACVISHEIIHSHKRHSIKQMKKSIVPGILKLPGTIIGGVMGEGMGNLINAPINAGTGALMASYSRKHEREADKLGMSIAAKSGYDPSQLAPILSNISRLAAYKSGKEEKKSYLKNHPYTPDRVEYINREKDKLTLTKSEKIYPDSVFAFRLNGLVIDQNPDQGLFIDHVFIHPILDIYFEFPKEWKTANSPETVGAVENHREGVVLLRIDTQHKSPEEAAKNFTKLIEEHQVEILLDDSTSIQQNPAHIIALKIPSNDYPLFVQNVWIELDSVVFNVIGYGLKKHMEEIHESINTFRSATPTDFKDLTVAKLKVTQYEQECSLQEVLENLDTMDYLEYIKIINNLEGDIIPPNKKIKIVIKQPVN